MLQAIAIPELQYNSQACSGLFARKHALISVSKSGSNVIGFTYSTHTQVSQYILTWA